MMLNRIWRDRGKVVGSGHARAFTMGKAVKGFTAIPSPRRVQLAKQPQPRVTSAACGYVCGDSVMRFLTKSNRSLVRSASVLGVALALSACSGGMDGLTGLMGGGNQQAQVRPTTATSFGGVPVEQLRADQLCPSIVVRDGTETLRLYAGEERTASNVRYQSQILQTVVECTPGAGQFGLTIGIAGRSIIGPQGTPATLDLPIRIVVFNTITDEVISSEVVRTQAIIEPTEVSATFTLVNRAFFVPAPQRQADYQVIIGFDEAGS